MLPSVTPIFEIADLVLSPNWMPSPVAEVTLRVVAAPADFFAIRRVSLFAEKNNLHLGPPFIWAPDWSGRHRGLTFASEAICATAAAQVIELVKAASPALSGGEWRC